MKFEIKPTRCDCHPETCCCPDYTLFIDGKRLVRDSNKDNLEQIVKIGETVIEHTKQACANAVSIAWHEHKWTCDISLDDIQEAIVQAEVE